MALLDAAERDEECRRLAVRVDLAVERAVERVRPEVAEHIHELQRRAHEYGERLALLAWRLAAAALTGAGS